MKVFVDDERAAPEGWVRVTSSAEAILLLELAKGGAWEITHLSLDHDLSIVEGHDDTTRPVMFWMVENNCWPTDLYVHTQNPVGEEWLVGMAKRYAPGDTLRDWGPRVVDDLRAIERLAHHRARKEVGDE